MPAQFRLGFLSHLHGTAEPRQLYRDYVELFVAAEELGFDSGWVAQHHFEDSAGRLLSPFPFLAAVAERTARIHLGTAVVTLPLEDPLRVAEDAAVLDALSGGRVELGVAQRLATDRVLPLATDLIVQFSPAAPVLDEAIAALELLATQVAPALGWQPARALTRPPGAPVSRR
jgi:alkanesulfonate monooxygenase SsuD/methylene tetrahydromethanopterin reductase-like flavin-dependent oxidoreductase (luciferase family)